MASRDLPPVMELVETTAPDVQPDPLPRAATPIRDTTEQNRARPLPRAPEALSDSDVNWVREMLDATPAAPAVAAAVKPSVVSADGNELMSMLGRFEQGVAERIALRDAADAKLRLVDRVAETVPETVVPTPEPSNDVGMDEALSAALDTLRKLSAKANGR
jgi:hypothetical protein